MQKAIFIIQQGLYKIEWDGANGISMPVMAFEVNKANFYSNGKFTDDAQALWTTNSNMICVNWGGIIHNSSRTTIMTRTDLDPNSGAQVMPSASTNDTTRFRGRK